MENKTREFNCKNEELPVICDFVGMSLERDLDSFTSYSPVFNEEYLTNFKSNTQAAAELVSPMSETIVLKKLNEKTYLVLDELITTMNHLEGYIGLAGDAVPLSAAEFGINQLRKGCRSRDVENVLATLRTVINNIGIYFEVLAAKGLTEEYAARFTDALALLSDNKKKAYKLISGRAALVQSNIGLLNQLYDDMTEICGIGKTLFKETDKAKTKDYTFAQLMKKVRRTEKPAEVVPQPAEAGQAQQ